MKIILIRHGQTEGNRKQWLMGQTNQPLNQTGINQAQKTAEHLKTLDVSIKTIFSSPLQMALQTADTIAKKLEIHPVEIIGDFIEFDYGQWEGQPLADLKKEFPKEYGYWMHDPFKLKIPGAETLPQVKERVKKGLDNVLRQSKEKDIVIVAHKSINKVLIDLLIGLETQDFWEVEQELACINIVEIQNGKATTKILNDIAHLIRK